MVTETDHWLWGIRRRSALQMDVFPVPEGPLMTTRAPRVLPVIGGDYGPKRPALPPAFGYNREGAKSAKREPETAGGAADAKEVSDARRQAPKETWVATVVHSRPPRSIFAGSASSHQLVSDFWSLCTALRPANQLSF